jgi:sulfite reductase (NADPH) hemoprotein beta-component
MYRYDEFDEQFVRERVTQFRNQVKRRLSGELTEEEFRPLRLMNGLYLQLHAYMLRVAIPYGSLSAAQMRALADISERYDRGYGHFTTRQNIQFNWPTLAQTPDLLEALADVQMHAIQTSGNCIRNITADPLAGVASDEVEDPRPTAELLRQWSSMHAEFSFLPRKFKIAVSGATADRAAVFFHDIGLRLLRNANGEVGYQVIVGGGQGRTPIVGTVLREFLPKGQLLGYVEALMRVYNLHGRRDNKYKARIKILLRDLGLQRFQAQVEASFAAAPHPRAQVEQAELARIAAYFSAPAYVDLSDDDGAPSLDPASSSAFARWLRYNVGEHMQAGYATVSITLKRVGGEPGDASAAQMRALAGLAEEFSFAELRITHDQNIVLPYVEQRALVRLWRALGEAGLDGANRGLVTDMIACPGLDYCTLATARSIPVAQSIAERFADQAEQSDIGPLSIKISGCINACGHHHVGHIGILGLEKNGREFYQLTLGGDATENAAIGERMGPGFASTDIVGAVSVVIDSYRAGRQADETFLEMYKRVGAKPFKEALYATDS